MGCGGNATERDNVGFKRAPSSNPPFSLADIRKAIHPHCFNRSLVRSSSYLLIDLAFSLLFYYVAATYLIKLSRPLSYVAWPIYWFLQGSVLNGLWVIGHECGHQAFSDYPWLNNTIGYILHSALLAPYFSFKYSHSRHHLNASSLQNDENHVPKIKSNLKPFYKMLNNPAGRMARLVILCTIGWILYVCFNVSGRRYEKFANHFDPRSPIYNDRERFQILVSDTGILVTSYALYKVALAKGFTYLVALYFGPLVITYGFLVVFVWLHHTHPSLPHYNSSEWNWLKGALSTVDRDYGVFNTIFHHITDTHVVHHLFVTMPHYHVIEATKAIKPLLGEYYQFDDTPILKAMWREATECFFVEEDTNKGVYWFNNKL